MSTSTVCDIPEALRALDENHQILEVLATMLLSDLPLQLEAIEAALDAGIASEVVHLTHCLKGSFSAFRAHQVCKQLFAIEQAARQGDLFAARRIFRQLEPQFAQCQVELEEGCAFHFAG